MTLHIVKSILTLTGTIYIHDEIMYTFLKKEVFADVEKEENVAPNMVLTSRIQYWIVKYRSKVGKLQFRKIIHSYLR